MVNFNPGKWLYGLLFTVLIPAYLLWLSATVQIELPAYQATLPGLGLAFLGGLMMLVGISDLWFKGKGLPMNAFPPRQLVKQGGYALVPHPIYLGFVLLFAGFSLYSGSASGLWLITPLIIVSCVALVWGYERPYLLRTFHALAQPWLGPPLANARYQRVGAFLALFLPWLILCESFRMIGPPIDTFSLRLSIESDIPVILWTYLIYASAYFFVLLPFILCKQEDLYDFFQVGWLSLLLMFLCYLALPITSPVREWVIVEPVGRVQAGLHALFQLTLNYAYPYTEAFPAYHIVWPVLAAHALARVSKVWRWIGWIWCFAIILSGFTTDMHTLLDVIAALVLGMTLYRAKAIWAFLLRACNYLANAYHSWQIGRCRIMSHFPFSFSAGFMQVFLAIWLVGTEYAFVVFILSTLGLLGAVLWGWLVEGAAVSQRPLGYFGSILAFLFSCIVLFLFDYPVLPIMAACFCAGTFAQAIGRMRCLVQGCCHGAVISGSTVAGLFVHNPRSRVVALSQLAQRSIYPTQLYSILGNLILGILLLRLWFLQADASLVIALYLIGSGLLRFVEEGYRGEVQTKNYYGLPVYQWLAILFVFMGSLILTLNQSALPVPEIDSPSIWIWSLLAGALGGLAGSIDFPTATGPFCKLEH